MSGSKFEQDKLPNLENDEWEDSVDIFSVCAHARLGSFPLTGRKRDSDQIMVPVKTALTRCGSKNFLSRSSTQIIMLMAKKGYGLFDEISPGCRLLDVKREAESELENQRKIQSPSNANDTFLWEGAVYSALYQTIKKLILSKDKQYFDAMPVDQDNAVIFDDIKLDQRMAGLQTIQLVLAKMVEKGPEYLKIFHLWYVEKKSEVEISKLLDLSRNGVDEVVRSIKSVLISFSREDNNFPHSNVQM